jgi:predicted transcriptional regulator
MKHIGSEVMSHKTSKLLDTLTRPMTVKELVLASDMKDASCRRALTIAMSEGFVKKTKSVVPNQGYIYSRVELTQDSIEPHWSNILEEVEAMKESWNKKKGK